MHTVSQTQGFGWVSLRRDQLIPVNKAVNEKEQLGKGLEEEERKKCFNNIFGQCTYQSLTGV
jgi:hypothetical protein